jgi:hypothetical protein
MLRRRTLVESSLQVVLVAVVMMIVMIMIMIMTRVGTGCRGGGWEGCAAAAGACPWYQVQCARMRCTATGSLKNLHHPWRCKRPMFKWRVPLQHVA